MTETEYKNFQNVVGDPLPVLGDPLGVVGDPLRVVGDRLVCCFKRVIT